MDYMVISMKNETCETPNQNDAQILDIYLNFTYPVEFLKINNK